MPELPEIETIKRGLEHQVSGKTISHIEIRRSDLRIPVPTNLHETARNATITQLHRRSKYLLIELNNQHTIIAHLGMSGKMTVVANKQDSFKKHDHIIFTFDDNSQLIFNDARRFGLIDLAQSNDIEQHKLICHLGVEPLSHHFNGKVLYNVTKKSPSPIKQILMNAKYVVGVGNIYASESLFRARISPLRKGKDVSQKECDILAGCVQDTLQDAITAGGSTLKDYAHSDGSMGYFQHQFNVYGRQNQACVSCSTPIIRAVQSNRSSFYCPTCQH